MPNDARRKADQEQKKAHPGDERQGALHIVCFSRNLGGWFDIHRPVRGMLMIVVGEMGNPDQRGSRNEGVSVMRSFMVLTGFGQLDPMPMGAGDAEQREYRTAGPHDEDTDHGRYDGMQPAGIVKGNPRRRHGNLRN